MNSLHYTNLTTDYQQSILRASRYIFILCRLLDQLVCKINARICNSVSRIESEIFSSFSLISIQKKLNKTSATRCYWVHTMCCLTRHQFDRQLTFSDKNDSNTLLEWKKYRKCFYTKHIYHTKGFGRFFSDSSTMEYYDSWNKLRYLGTMSKRFSETDP